MLARFGQTNRGELASAAAALRQAGAPLIGAVVTMTPPREVGSERGTLLRHHRWRPSEFPGTGVALAPRPAQEVSGSARSWTETNLINGTAGLSS